MRHQHESVIERPDLRLLAPAELDRAADLDGEAQLVAPVAVDLGIRAAEDKVRVDGVDVGALGLVVDGRALLLEQVLQLGQGGADVAVDADVGLEAGAGELGGRGDVELGQLVRGRARGPTAAR